MTPIEDFESWPGEGPEKETRRFRTLPNPGASLDGWQIAGVTLLWIYLSPALVTWEIQDFWNGLGMTLLSSTLLAWLLTPLKRSDDLYDDTSRRQAERIDVMAVVLIWTWPLSFGVPIAAVVRWVAVFWIGPPS